MTEAIISALLPPTDAHSPDRLPSTSRPNLGRPPLAELASLLPNPATYYGMGSIDASGRIANRTVVKALGWRTGDRLEFQVAGGVIVARPVPHGLATMWHAPYVAIPAPIRHLCGLRSGDRVFVVAHPAHQNLIVYTTPVLDQLLHDHHASLLPGDAQ
ncbi:AbrB/MazE/SpoVT family DNA-binding domain-containing protein [Crossiella sp. CA198]|uniref:AbrB/MazE/SpoVT family DNA-binding domain-containing protein n=1 Tax=Crossiella sp. CA198 TaxID=3455607 RepID=UPI003F8D741D